MSATEAPPNWSAARIWSAVWLAAPFSVIPSANDALSGETNTFVSGWAALILPQSAKANVFAASRTVVSLEVSARGSAVSGTGWVDGVDGVDWVGDVLHAATASRAAKTAPIPTGRTIVPACLSIQWLPVRRAKVSRRYTQPSYGAALDTYTEYQMSRSILAPAASRSAANFLFSGAVVWASKAAALSI